MDSRVGVLDRMNDMELERSSMDSKDGSLA